MSSLNTREPALEPEDLARFSTARANAGDVEGLVALYEPDAVLASPGGQFAVGHRAAREFYTELLSTRRKFQEEITIQEN
jgi:ketosteroid isomerase-like protein